MEPFTLLWIDGGLRGFHAEVKEIVIASLLLITSISKPTVTGQTFAASPCK
jgi:hypothetical protein